MDLKLVEARLAELEKELDARLPADYRRFLLGLERAFVAHPEFREALDEVDLEDPYWNYKSEYLLAEAPNPAYHTFFKDRRPHFEVVNLYSLLDKIPCDLLSAYRRCREATGRADLVPLGDNGCGDYLCIGVTGRDRGRLFSCGHEGGYNCGFLAASFRDFVAQTKPS